MQDNVLNKQSFKTWALNKSWKPHDHVKLKSNQL